MLSNNSNGQNTNNYPVPQASSRDSLDVNLSEYFVKVKRRWKPALAIFLLTLGVAGGLSLLQKQTYQAKGKLLFKQKSSAVLTGIGEESEYFTANLTRSNAFEYSNSDFGVRTSHSTGNRSPKIDR